LPVALGAGDVLVGVVAGVEVGSVVAGAEETTLGFSREPAAEGEDGAGVSGDGVVDVG